MRERDVVGDLYDAAVASRDWHSIPAIIARYLASDSAVVTLVAPEQPIVGATAGLPEEAIRAYAEHYYLVDPWFAAGRVRLSPFHGAVTSELLPDEEFMRTEFYADFAKPFGTVEAVGGYVPLGPTSVLTVAAHRSRRGSFGRADAARVQRLLPHLQRAMLLRRRLGEQIPPAIGFAALDALAVGAVICDSLGRILFANAAAETISDSGEGVRLGYSAHGIRTLLPGEGRRLAGLMAEAARTGAGGALALSRPNGKRLLVLVTPLPSSFGVGPGHILVTLQAEKARPTFESAALGSMFGLTSAEATLALALLSGDKLAHIASERGISENTARSQLAQVLRKTRTASQRDLVRLLSLIPAVR